MLSLIVRFIDMIQPLIIPLCFIIAWVFIFALGSSVIGTIVDVIKRSKKMHEIPCTHCQYFTNDHRLKCPVNPFQANTEEAINCKDYQMREY
ncbi:hypothetical protein [Cyanothece sp. BG0011]|uniref:hypothetical protein n=1 Tax=Cyanothece sp. BG0011 TaxID=2082950 RepID=UPI000D1E6057|nr:hypothetical protein [Cyanothece sp. BG0011]